MRTTVWTLIILAMMAPSADAGSTVITASGSVGSFSFLNAGINGSGTATIFVAVPNVASTLDTVNGVAVPPEPTSVAGPLTLLVTPTGGGDYNLAFTPGDAIQTVGGTVGQQAELTFNLSKGNTPLSLVNFFNLSGPITGLLANANPLYDFSEFASGGQMNFALTATSFQGTSSFAGLFSTVGATAVGNGAFSQAVSEPATAILFGLGLTALALWRRVRAKP